MRSLLQAAPYYGTWARKSQIVLTVSLGEREKKKENPPYQGWMVSQYINQKWQWARLNQLHAGHFSAAAGIKNEKVRGKKGFFPAGIFSLLDSLSGTSAGR